MAKSPKQPSRKSAVTRVWHDLLWTVGRGRLVPGPGRPKKTRRLFQVVGEKLPIESLKDVAKKVTGGGGAVEGVYLAHDSMGYVRYVGRGQIFERLRARIRAEPLAIRYFSFYVVQAKPHEREIETLLIRTAAPMLYFNERKKRLNLSPGNIRDYEPGTEFYERHKRKGKRAAE